MVPRSRAWFVVVAALAVGSAVARAAFAVPLDPAQCDKARAEQTELLADVPRLMERGANWAKQNASPEQLRRVARWIELEEQLQFRCGQVKLSAGASAAAAAAEALEAPPPPAGPAPSAGAPPTLQPQQKPATPTAAANGPAAPAKPKSRAKPPADAQQQPATSSSASNVAPGAAPAAAEVAPKPRKPKPQPSAAGAAAGSAEAAGSAP